MIMSAFGNNDVSTEASLTRTAGSATVSMILDDDEIFLSAVFDEARLLVILNIV